MDLLSNLPFPVLQTGKIHTYPTLDKNIRTDVIVMGAGITGALITWYLSQAGIPCITIDKGHPGMSSTAACTSLLQYEIDTPLHALCHYVGEQHANRSYILCRQAIYKLQAVCAKLGTVNFEMKPSFQFASFKKDVKELQSEYRLRKNLGIELSYLESPDILKKFGFSKPGGLLSADGAVVDAYCLTHELLQSSIRKGCQVFDQTNIREISHQKHGVELLTQAGHTIKAKKLIISCGYESLRFIEKKVADLNSTYVIVNKPSTHKKLWFNNAMIWETATPYLYIRPTSDNRILVGGKDEEFYNPQKRDAVLGKKALALQKAFTKLFPQIPFFIDFQWAGTFGTTKDGLPFIGSIPERPHTYFALAFGGNGITFSVIAARILRDILGGKSNKDLEIFSFNR